MSLTASRLAMLLAGLIGFAAIAGALTLQYGFGYQPCPLCLEQRWPYYLGVPVLLLLALLGHRLPKRAFVLVTVLLALLFAYGCGLGIYHSGVEWQWWPGPVDCSAAGGLPSADSGSLLDAINSQTVVSCADTRIRVLGLSLAGWNAAVMLVLVVLSLLAARWAVARQAVRSR